MRNYQGVDAGLNVIFFSFTEKQLGTGSFWREAIRVRVARAGELAISFEFRSDTVDVTSFGAVFRNGGMVGGALPAYSETGWTFYIAPIPGWVPGDILQIAVFSNPGGQTSMRRVTLYADQNFHDVEVRSTNPAL